MFQRLSQTVSPPSADSEVSVDWSVNRSFCHWSRYWSWRDLIMAVWLWLVFLFTCWTVCSLYLILQRVWSVTRRSTTTPHISSGTSTGCGFPKEYNFDWPYSFSAAVTTWRLHTSSAIFNGLTKQSRCDDYGPALNSTWSYLERDSKPSVTDLSVWQLLVHGTVFQPVSLYSNFHGFLQKTTKNISFHKVFPGTLVCVPCPWSTFAHATLIRF